MESMAQGLHERRNELWTPACVAAAKTVVDFCNGGVEIVSDC